MSMKCLVRPAVEPVSVAQLRDWLRIDGSVEDATLQSLVTAARTTLEGWTRRAFIEQVWEITWSGPFHGGVLRLPLGPPVATGPVRLYDGAGVETSLAPAQVSLDLDDQRPALRIAGVAAAASAQRAVAEVTLGYGAAAEDVPAPLRQAILMLATFWHGRRGDDDEHDRAIPRAVSRLAAPWRRGGLS